jgi:His-Xaa-Ser system protein HxsD
MSDETVVAKFDRHVYRLSAIKKAAYNYGGLFHILIEDGDDFIAVSLKPTAGCHDAKVAEGEFCNEVLDQELREDIAAETGGIRDLLLAQAFSKTSLIDSNLETEDYQPALDTGDSAEPSE